MADSFRPLTKNEREVLEWMLQPTFPGRDELRAQLEVATARNIDDDGCIELDCGAAAPAPVKCLIPTEGECADEVGLPIYVLLFVPHGFMKTLEVHWVGDSTPRGLPEASRLTLFAPYSEDAGVWNTSDRFLRRRVP